MDNEVILFNIEVNHLRRFGISFFESFETQAELEAYQGMASVGKIFMILEHGF